MSLADRVRKLAALAGSDNEHEASSAALQACKLIREGKVTIHDLRATESHESYARPSPRTRHTWYEPAPPPPPPPPPRVVPRGPFTRKPGVRGEQCVVCHDTIQLGDGFSCTDGYVHGDCIPAGQRP